MPGLNRLLTTSGRYSPHQQLPQRNRMVGGLRKPSDHSPPDPGSVEVEAEALTLHQPADLAADLLQQRRAHVGMALDLIDKALHIGRSHAMAADPGFNLAAKCLQQRGLIL